MNQRVTSIDTVRGLMIILMILGHVRWLYFSTTIDPIYLADSQPGLFLLRVLSSLAAPSFYFLSGMGIYFLVKNRDSLYSASKELMVRGLILIALDIGFVSMHWITLWPTFEYTFLLGVLWSLGASMIILSLLIHLPVKWIAAVALLVLFGHSLLTPLFNFSYQDNLSSLFAMLLHGKATYISLNDYLNIEFAYAIMPWFAVMALGYTFAHLIFAPTITTEQRRLIFLYTGLTFIAVFLALRILLGYGDPNLWVWQANNPTFSLLDFVKLGKYPPSLQYILLGLGIGCLLLRFFDQYQSKIGNYLFVFGQTPLFLYVIHIPLLKISALLVKHTFFDGANNLGDIFPAPALGMIIVFLAFLPLLYWACKMYRPIKVKYRHTMLKYL